MAKAKTFGGKWAGEIPDFARRIGEAARARRVVLFGSAARGEMREHSDLDFLVVIPQGRHRRPAQRRARRALGELGFRKARPAVDIFVVTEAGARKRRDGHDAVVWPALDEGREVWSADVVR